MKTMPIKATLITGCAGSGKSSLAAELQKLGYNAFDIESIPGLFSEINRKTGQPTTDKSVNDSVDAVKKFAWTCDIGTLQSLIKQNRNQPSFYCGVAANLYEIIPLFDDLYFLTTSSDEIRNRLKRRKPGQFGNSEDVQDWILKRKSKFEHELRIRGAKAIQSQSDASATALELLETINSIAGD